MLEILNEWDHQIFYYIVHELRSDKLDYLLTIWRDKYFWFPLYLGFILWLIVYYKKWYLYLLAILILITLSDQISSGLLKKNVKRERPCREEGFSESYKPLIHCSGAYSFPSSHATNHMALAVFLFFAFKPTLRRANRVGLIIWAVSIGYAQIYVGVHFPFDVLFGLCLGAFIGYIIWYGFNRFLRYASKN